MRTTRRRFLATTGRTIAAAAVADAPDVIAQPAIKWRLSTGWTAAFEIHQGTAQRLAEIVDEMSGYYPGWHEPGTTLNFGFNLKAYQALPVDLQRTLDHGASAVQVHGLTEFHVKHAIALRRLKTEFKGTVEVLMLPAPVLRDLKKLAAGVIREESEKSSMARKAHASYTKFQALVGPRDHVAEGAYHQLVGA